MINISAHICNIDIIIYLESIYKYFCENNKPIHNWEKHMRKV